MPAFSRRVSIEFLSVENPEIVAASEIAGGILFCQINDSDDQFTVRQRVVNLVRAQADFSERISCVVFSKDDCVYVHPHKKPFDSQNPMNSGVIITTEKKGG